MERALLTTRDMHSLTKAASKRSQARPERVRCMVVESGASAPTPEAGSFDETIVVAQTLGEQPALFVQRVMARLATVERSHRHFDSLTFSTGSQRDRASTAARRLIWLGLAAHARAGRGTSELLLRACPHAGPELRAELLGLIEEALAASDGEPAPVRLVFGSDSAEPAPRSGIFPVVEQGRDRSVRAAG